VPWNSSTLPFPGDLAEEYFDMPPYGQILVLSPPSERVKIREDAVARRLLKFAEQPTPFVGIVIDLAGRDYLFSESDIASVGAVIAAWVRGWVAPCSMVLTGRSAENLRRTLEIVQMSQLEELRVVDSRESALNHVRMQLARARSPDEPR
jgi:hypothetical protein